MTTPRVPDPIEAYLNQLQASLHTPPHETRLILAEAEDHLRESAAAGLAAGLTEAEAQEAAISAFGSVRAVARAHQARLGQAVAVAADALMAACKLTSLFLLAFIVSYLLRFARLKLSASPAGGQVSYLNRTWLFPAIVDLAVFAGYQVVRRVRQRRGQAPQMLFGGYFPLVAAVFFAAATVGMTLLVRPATGPAVLAALAAGYAVRTWRTLPRRRNIARTLRRQ
jgi:vacuolar-type H+-ATPase subunit H